MAKDNYIITSHINDIKRYITLVRNSIMAYKKNNDRADIIEALYYSRRITKLLMKLYIKNRFSTKKL